MKKNEAQQVQYKRTTNILQDSIERIEKELKNATEQFQIELQLKDEAIAKLQKERAQLIAKQAKLTATPPGMQNRATSASSANASAPSWPPPPPPAYKISTVTTARTPAPLKRPTDRAKELLPFRIFGVAGSKQITGTHISRKFVETDETYKDEFGNTKKRGEWEKKTVEEYGYRIRFSIENLSNREQTIKARAGLVDKVFLLKPGAIQSNMLIDAAKGSSLIVGAEGQSTRVPVSY